MINVLIVDDHPSIGEGTKVIIEQQADMQADMIVESEQVLDRLKEKNYDVYVVDLFMPKLNGVDLAKAILRIDPDAVILIYTGYDVMQHYTLIMDAGVAGFISKTASSEQLITAIRCALRGEVMIPLQLLRQVINAERRSLGIDHPKNIADVVLSSREREILREVAKGLTNVVIAQNLKMSQRTVELSLTKVFTKLGVSSRIEAYLRAEEYELL